MVVALSLVVIMEQHLTKMILKRCLQVLVVVIALTTALSRIYLGVHYPSDIFGRLVTSIYYRSRNLSIL